MSNPSLPTNLIASSEFAGSGAAATASSNKAIGSGLGSETVSSVSTRLRVTLPAYWLTRAGSAAATSSGAVIGTFTTGVGGSTLVPLAMGATLSAGVGVALKRLGRKTAAATAAAIAAAANS